MSTLAVEGEWDKRMKRNIVPLLGIAFVVAIVSTGVFYGLFAGKLKSSSSEITGQSIVVAAHDLQRGTVVSAGDLRESQIKGELKGSFSKTKDAVGVTLLEAVQENAPLLQDRVASHDPKVNGGGSGPATGIRNGVKLPRADSPATMPRDRSRSTKARCSSYGDASMARR